VTLTKNAEEDLSYFKIYEQRIIVNSLLNNLKTDADIESKKFVSVHRGEGGGKS
jgi:hypothetical protein